MSSIDFSRWIAVAGIVCAGLTGQTAAQVPDQSSRSGGKYTRITRLYPGTVIPVRMSETVDVKRSDISAQAVLTSRISRVYGGIVAQDVRGENGQLAISSGSNVRMIVRLTRDNNVVLDLDSVIVDGKRYAVRTENKPVGSPPDDYITGKIVDNIQSGQGPREAVSVSRGSLVMFRLERPLEMVSPER